MWMPVMLYVQVTIEETSGGQKQVKLVRLPQQAAGDAEMIDLNAHRLGAKSTAGDQPEIDFTPVVSVQLYWPQTMPNEKSREKIRQHLYQYVKNLMAVDEQFRDSILSRLQGTGWYLGQELVK